MEGLRNKNNEVRGTTEGNDFDGQDNSQLSGHIRKSSDLTIKTQTHTQKKPHFIFNHNNHVVSDSRALGLTFK